MIIKDVTGIIDYKNLLEIIADQDCAFILDKYNDGYSIAGFSLNQKSSHIVTDSLNEFYNKIKSKIYSNPHEYNIDYPQFGSGWYGYISYDLKNNLYPLKLKNRIPRLPLLQFIYVPAVLRINHRTHQITCISEDSTACEELYEKIKKSLAPGHNDMALTVEYLCPFEHYKKCIELIRDEIIVGNVYQVNFAHKIIFKFTGHPFDCYKAIQKKAKPAHGAYFKFDDLHILSFSPEQFFKLEKGIISSFPIKGTMPRSRNKQKDAYYRKQLEESIKDKAEHLMIVDLIRNDLGKICQTGSISVTDLFKIESFPTVHHMVSNVSGILKKEITIVDIIKAMFPGGSVTGAPKIAAMNYIEELEDFSREIYTGSLGYIGCNMNMDFNIAIRTLIIQNDEASYATGGGIVYDSNPYNEYQETLTKTRILVPLVREIGR